MIVCVCNNVNEKKIKTAIEQHAATSLDDLQQHIDVCDQCCCCEREIHEILKVTSNVSS